MPGHEERAVSIAHSVLDGSTPLVSGCRQLTAELARLDADHDDAFSVLLVVDSDSDHLPTTPTERPRWSPEALKDADRELEQIEAMYGEQVRRACRAIIVRYGSGP